MRGGDGNDSARNDLRQFGATEEQIDAQLGPRQDDFDVWPENWEAVQAFLQVQTQWITGLSGLTGLDYHRVRAGLRMAGVKVTPDLFARLRVIEDAVLKTLSENKTSP